MKYLFGILMLACSLNSSGQYYRKQQNPDKNYKQLPSKQITINLSPIVLSRSRYYYDGRHVTFDQLTMPLLAVKDSAVNHYFKSVLRTRLIGAAFQIGIGIASSAVWLRSGNTPINSNLFLALTLGHLVLSRITRQFMISPERKAVDRYNEIILQPSALVLPGNGIGLGVTARF